jgi:lactate 2-monooxygenase
MDGIVVSNHGGRQLDGSIASLDTLGPIVDAVGDRLEVLFDSGVRTASDVLKALALGARAVFYGRPWVYGLGLGGTDGVRHVLRGLLADLDLSLGLSGHRTLSDLNRESLVHRP